MESEQTRSPAGSVLTRRRLRPQAAGPLPRAAGPRLAGLATSDSAEVFTQAQVLERLGLTGNEFAEGIFARCGVKRRHLDLSSDFMARTLQGRSAEIEHDLLRHSIRAVDALEIDPAAVRTVVTSSLYTLGCPTLAHRLVDHYEMDPATDKYHVSGVGCASGVPLMRLAAQSLREYPGGQALVVAADSLSGILSLAAPGDPKAKTVGSAIFGDGCAAALLAGDARSEGPRILDSQVHQIGGTLGAVSLEVESEDSYLHLARDLPDLAGAGILEVVERFLARSELERSDIDHWLVHPGGRRIIENVRDALEISDEDLASSWAALAEHGNVGTPAIFYVLEETLGQCKPRPGEHAMLVTIGPGVTLGLLLLGW